MSEQTAQGPGFVPIVEPDNWRNRSAKMRCATCMWFVAKESSAENNIGRCRKHAPTLQGWPAVYTGDWCGDHKIDEEKVT